MQVVMMACGHAANAVRVMPDGTDVPCCVICAGIEGGKEYEVVESPDLTGREAKCTYCGKTKPSALGLPFFEHLPDDEFDRAYDGCRGWD